MRYYERLCRKYNVLSDADKIENLTQYCSRDVREFMEGLRTYAQRDWEEFVKDVKKYYEADRNAKRYKVRHLEKYAMRMRMRSTPNMAGWIKTWGL